MELGLSLGEPQAKSPEKMICVGGSPSTKLKLGFCAGPGFGREIRGQELDEEEMEGETEKKGRPVHSPVQLDLLLPHHFPLPSQTRNSEPPLEEEASDEEENGSLSKKKLRLSKEQSAFLEQSFKEHNTLNPRQKHDLAKQLNLRPRQVEVWFQNRRARTKLKQTEVNCDYLKRCCETLREENRRLQKELSELRALKRSDCSCTQLPATTLAMCPSCERVSSTNRRCCFSLH